MQLFWLNLIGVCTSLHFLSASPAAFNVNDTVLASGHEQDLSKNYERNHVITLKRGKRYLDFTKGTRMSWRTTVKNNILKVNTLWSYGFGFRANFPFPDKADRRRPFFKRDVFQSLSDVLDGNGLDGQACLLKSFCTAHLDADSDISSGMLFKLLKYIFTWHVIKSKDTMHHQKVTKFHGYYRKSLPIKAGVCYTVEEKIFAPGKSPAMQQSLISEAIVVSIVNIVTRCPYLQ